MRLLQVKRFKGNEQSPSTFFALPVQAAVAREVSRLLNTLSGRSADAFDWQPNLLKFPHPQLRSIGMAGYVLGPFIFASCMFGLVIQVSRPKLGTAVTFYCYLLQATLEISTREASLLTSC